MYLFSTNNTTPLYAFEDTDNYLPYCGMSSYNYNTGCCISSTNLTATTNYNSFTRSFVLDTIPANIPASANSHSYCVVTGMDNSSFWGYQQGYYLQGNICLEGNIKCTTTGLEIYLDETCQTLSETLLLDNSLQKSNSLGNITVGVQSFNNASVTFGYTCFSPSWLLIPDYRDTVDYFTTLFYSLSVFISFATVVIFTKKYLINGKKSTLFMVIAQSMWTIRAITKFYTTYVVQNNSIFSKTVNIMAVIFESGTLFALYINVILYFQLYKEYKKYRPLAFIIGALIHIGLVCLWYGAGLASEIPGQMDLSNTLYGLSWVPYSIWFFSYPFVDCLIPAILLYKLKGKCSVQVARLDEPSQIAYNREMKKLVVLLVLQFLNASTSGTIELVQYNTNLFTPTDKVNLTMTSFTTLLLSIHSVIFVTVYDKFTTITFTLVHGVVSDQREDKPTPVLREVEAEFRNTPNHTVHLQETDIVSQPRN
ncbi:hypothetical protein HDV06_003660 [Boothiomyces sp. JEL0866]|nr:hypothetical protein HDV06_003660 [Boothiomyces sp. JEL0866]